MKEKVESSCLVEPTTEGEESHVQIKMTGSTTGLLAAYEQLSVNLFKTIEESYDAGFAIASYTIVQKRLMEGVPALKKDFEAFEATAKKLSPLMSILGKTFRAGGDK